MKRVVVVALALLALACAVACVTGTTPDCSTPASGCFPGGNPQDGGSDANDANDDASDASDGGQTDASDASSITDSPSDG